jgi:hypothetical protein
LQKKRVKGAYKLLIKKLFMTFSDDCMASEPEKQTKIMKEKSS